MTSQWHKVTLDFQVNNGGISIKSTKFLNNPSRLGSSSCWTRAMKAGQKPKGLQIGATEKYLIKCPVCVYIEM